MPPEPLDFQQAACTEYGPVTLPGLRADALTAMAALPARLPSADAQWLAEKTAWPCQVVESGGDVTGYRTRAVPDRFHVTLGSLSGAPGAARRPATLEFLLNPDAYARQVGVPVGNRGRLLLLADIAATVTRLHSMGITLADVPPKDLLFAMAPSPECFMTACGAMRLHGADAMPQAEAPDWRAPDGEPRGTQQADAYKFALLAIRVIARDQRSTDPAALASIAPALGDLARSALASDPAARPAPAAWHDQLIAAATAAGGPPATLPAKAGGITADPGRPGMPRALQAVAAIGVTAVLVIVVGAVASIRVKTTIAAAAPAPVAALAPQPTGPALPAPASSPATTVPASTQPATTLPATTAPATTATATGPPVSSAPAPPAPPPSTGTGQSAQAQCYQVLNSSNPYIAAANTDVEDKDVQAAASSLSQLGDNLTADEGQVADASERSAIGNVAADASAAGTALADGNYSAARSALSAMQTDVSALNQVCGTLS